MAEAATIRTYGLDRERRVDERDAVHRAAGREYELIGGLVHPGFDRASDLNASEGVEPLCAGTCALRACPRRQRAPLLLREVEA